MRLNKNREERDRNTENKFKNMTIKAFIRIYENGSNFI